MASPYTGVAVIGYNANPPADDGSAVSTNQIKWATIKTKLDDPLNTAIASINANVVTAFGKTPAGASTTSTGANVAVTSSDQGKWFRATASGITITFPDATSVGSPFIFQVLNSAAGNITLAGAGGQTINGSTSITMAAGDGYAVFTDGSNWFVTGRKTGVLPTLYRSGCKAANGADATNDTTFTAGKWRDSTDTVDLTIPAFSTGKQLDANWAPGDAAGCRNSAAGIANGTYHYYAVGKADGSNADIYTVAGVAGTDAESAASYAAVITALHLESGGSLYVYARRIFSIVRAGATILAFTQHGNEVVLTVPVGDYNTANPGTSAVTIGLASVPVGVKSQAVIQASAVAATTTNIDVLFSALHQTDTAPDPNNMTLSTTSASVVGFSVPLRIWVDLSSQIRARMSASGAADRLKAITGGWVDPFGQDA